MQVWHGCHLEKFQNIVYPPPPPPPKKTHGINFRNVIKFIILTREERFTKRINLCRARQTWFAIQTWPALTSQSGRKNAEIALRGKLKIWLVKETVLLLLLSAKFYMPALQIFEGWKLMADKINKIIHIDVLEAEQPKRNTLQWRRESE